MKERQGFTPARSIKTIDYILLPEGQTNYLAYRRANAWGINTWLPPRKIFSETFGKSKQR